MIPAFKYTLVAFSLSALVACSGSSSRSSSNVIAPPVCGTDPVIELDEGNGGDFSDNPALPKEWKLAPGANTLRAGTEDNPDYVAFTVDACDVLNSITLISYTASGETDNVAFMALQAGSVFTGRENEFLGSTDFGVATRGLDILGLAGVTGPLGPGTYTMWVREPAVKSEYILSFSVDRVR